MSISGVLLVSTSGFVFKSKGARYLNGWVFRPAIGTLLSTTQVLGLFGFARPNP